jgi:hypothetical protein
MMDETVEKQNDLVDRDVPKLVLYSMNPGLKRLPARLYPFR